jgi:hypothetical protein
MQQGTNLKTTTIRLKDLMPKFCNYRFGQLCISAGNGIYCSKCTHARAYIYTGEFEGLQGRCSQAIIFTVSKSK